MPIEGVMYDDDPILQQLRPYYENLPNVDMATLISVKVERLFGVLG